MNERPDNPVLHVEGDKDREWLCGNEGPPVSEHSVWQLLKFKLRSILILLLQAIRYDREFEAVVPKSFMEIVVNRHSVMHHGERDQHDLADTLS
jgi:hypothetical protein